MFDVMSFDYSIHDIKIGMTASYTQMITDNEIKSYAALSGDDNPVHMDEEYAANSRFGRRIAHGMISSGFFSQIFGKKIPGPGCVYVSQSLKFKRPVYLDDTVTATVVVTDVNHDKKIVTFDTFCKVKNKVVITGVAELFVPGEKIQHIK